MSLTTKRFIYIFEHTAISPRSQWTNCYIHWYIKCTSSVWLWIPLGLSANTCLYMSLNQWSFKNCTFLIGHDASLIRYEFGYHRVSTYMAWSFGGFKWMVYSLYFRRFPRLREIHDHIWILVKMVLYTLILLEIVCILTWILICHHLGIPARIIEDWPVNNTCWVQALLTPVLTPTRPVLYITRDNM